MARRRKVVQAPVNDVVVDEIESPPSPPPSPVRVRNSKNSRKTTKKSETTSKKPLRKEKKVTVVDPSEEVSKQEEEEVSVPTVKKVSGRQKKNSVASKTASATKKVVSKRSKSKSTGDKTVPEENEQEIENPKKKTRFFQILVDSIKPEINSEDISAGGGRYTGIPTQAAKKAFTKICKIHAQNDSDTGETCSYVFSIKEITRGSKQAVFTYQGDRYLLPDPKEIVRGGASYTVKYGTHLVSLRGKQLQSTEE